MRAQKNEMRRGHEEVDYDDDEKDDDEPSPFRLPLSRPSKSF